MGSNPTKNWYFPTCSAPWTDFGRGCWAPADIRRSLRSTRWLPVGVWCWSDKLLTVIIKMIANNHPDSLIKNWLVLLFSHFWMCLWVPSEPLSDAVAGDVTLTVVGLPWRVGSGSGLGPYHISQLTGSTAEGVWRVLENPTINCFQNIFNTIIVITCDAPDEIKQQWNWKKKKETSDYSIAMAKSFFSLLFLITSFWRQGINQSTLIAHICPTMEIFSIDKSEIKPINWILTI